jgi:RNA polymerase sigma-70 factor (ECF subfamily)
VKTSRNVPPDSPLPDESRLAHRAKSGDADAFTRLYDGYVGRVYRYIYFRVQDDAAVEEITSRVFLDAWERLERYQASRLSFIAWLYVLARNQVMDYYRSFAGTAALDNAPPSTSDALDEEEVQHAFDLQVIRGAQQFLSEEQQQVLILKFIAGLPTENIARLMLKSEGVICALQNQALQMLASYVPEKEVT